MATRLKEHWPAVIAVIGFAILVGVAVWAVSTSPAYVLSTLKF
jgi:ABC-type transporter Mla subunit MlaD